MKGTDFLICTLKNVPTLCFKTLRTYWPWFLSERCSSSVFLLYSVVHMLKQCIWPHNWSTCQGKCIAKNVTLIWNAQTLNAKAFACKLVFHEDIMIQNNMKKKLYISTAFKFILQTYARENIIDRWYISLVIFQVNFMKYYLFNIIAF